MRLFRSVICLAAALGCATAQQSATWCTLTGRAEDPSGAAIPASAVKVSDAATGVARAVVTNDEGRFRLDALPPGSYDVKVEHPRFAPAMRRITLTVGQTLDLGIRLPLAGSAESINVRATAPVLEAARTEMAGTVSPREIDSLPANGRNYLDLALLVPGVSRTNTGSSQLFAETSAVPGIGISIGGQRNLNNSFLVDGLSANDDAAGLAGTFYGEEVIREFQVVTSGGIAEFGRASAGVVNVITQSGTNAWHGRVYSFARNQRLDARNALANHKDPLTRAQYGATLAGPLRRDRLFFFTNLEQTRENSELQVTISPQNVAAINSGLRSFGYAGSLITTGGAPTALHTTNFFARSDIQLAANNRATVRYSLYDVAGVNARNAGGLNATTRGTALQDRDQTVALSDQAALSPHTLNEVRVQVTRSRLAAPVNDPAGPAVSISGVANFGASTASPTARDLDLYELNESLLVVRGKHSFKTGLDWLEDRTSIWFPGATPGVYSFSSLAAFASGKYTNFQQAFGQPVQRVPNANVGAFAQDEWRPVAGFTLNAGLRYDYSALPAPIRPQTRNFSPRLGVAYSPHDHKFVLRASAGIFYNRIPLRAVSNALQRDGVNYRVAVLAFGQPGAPVFPSVMPAFPSGVLTSISTIDPHIRNDYSVQASVQLEREVAPGSVFSAGYEHLRGIHIIVQRNLNVPTAANAPNLGRPNPAYGNISQYESAGDSYYNAMTLAFTHKASRYVTFRAAYTVSKSIDDTGTFFFSMPQDNFQLRADRGLADSDQRHSVSASGSVHSPWKRAALAGWQASSILSYGSALPFNIQTGNDRNGDTNANDRPAGIGRNTGRGFNYITLDGRVSRSFRVEKASLELLLEGFNLLNRANWQFPNNVFGTGAQPLPSFGRPTAAAAARQMQVGVRIGF